MREKHTFTFTGRQISEAAHDEWEYHEERAKWWTLEQAAVVQEAKSSTVKVVEAQHTGGKGYQIVIDYSINERLQRCGLKIAEHQKAASDFSIHAGAYASNAAAHFELDPADVIYFRLAGGARAE